jgi:hypothetical protein
MFKIVTAEGIVFDRLEWEQACSLLALCAEVQLFWILPIVTTKEWLVYDGIKDSVK